MARYELKLPQMGESVEEATVSSWLKKVGDTVQIDDILVEVATDKVDSEIPSDVSGVIVEILTPEKTVVKVGELMAIIETDVQEASPEPIIQLSSAEAPILIEPTQEAIVPVASQEHTQETTQVPEIQEEEIAQQVPYVPAPIQIEASKNEGITQEDPFFSPLVRTIAKEENISEEELRTIEGTGLAGRITKYDILRYIENKKGGISSLSEGTSKQEDAPKVREEESSSIQNNVPEETVAMGVSPFAPVQSSESSLVQESANTIEKQLPEPIQELPKAEDLQEEVITSVQPSEITSIQETTFSDAETHLPAPIQDLPVVESSEQKTLEEILPEEELPQEAVQENKEETPQELSQEEVKYPDIADFMKTFAASHPKQEQVTAQVSDYKEAEQPKINLEVPKNKPEEKPVPASYTTSPVDDNVEVIEMTRMGKLIANYMSESKKISAHATSFIEVDVTRIWNWRNKHKKQFEARSGEKLTFTPIFLEAVAKALRDFPMMNITTDGEHIFKKKNINIGMATALPNGDLIVPVIKNADQLSLLGLAKSVNDLAKRARENKLKPEEVKGGTYTLTNIGAFGNLFGTPILNQPEVGILAVGAIQKVPAVVETPEGDVIAIRYKLMLSHSFDHRVVNGALGGMFVQRVAQYLQQWDSNREV